jgi:hypothetical protein
MFTSQYYNGTLLSNSFYTPIYTDPTTNATTGVMSFNAASSAYIDLNRVNDTAGAGKTFPQLVYTSFTLSMWVKWTDGASPGSFARFFDVSNHCSQHISN